MKYYNEDRTEELKYEDIDREKGYIEYIKETVHHDEVPYVEEVGHYETVAEYPNGGKDVEWVVDTPGSQHQEAYDEEVTVGIYKLYTEEDLEYRECTNKVFEYKQKLIDTDYLAIKHSEGVISDEDYEPIKVQRQEYRDKVNMYQNRIEVLKKIGVYE